MEESKAEKLVRWPAVALLFVGAFDLLLFIASLALFSGEWFDEFMAENYPDADWGSADALSTFNLVNAILGVAITLIVIAGGVAMLKGRLWGLALAAAILTMIPCFGPCCGIFLPVGVWTLIVLLKPEVKELLSPGAGPA